MRWDGVGAGAGAGAYDCPACLLAWHDVLFFLFFFFRCLFFLPFSSLIPLQIVGSVCA